VGKKAELITLGAVDLHKLKDHYLTLKEVFNAVTALIEKYLPDEMAIEAPFFGKNVQSMLKLGRAQGICIAAAFSRSIPFVEYSPRKVKQSITGNGAASKEQVANMLQRMFNFESIPSHLDATDALAVAVCHSYQKEELSSVKTTAKKSSTKKTSWASFISQNPDRVK
jgi:crossover junction endodeoxyribonuclease RuvC